MISQTLWRTARARVLVARGELVEAVSLARDATGLILETDALPYQGDALLDFADVLVAAGCHAEARTAARDAFGIYRRKEYTLGATRVRTLLTRLEQRSAPLANRLD